MGCRRILLIVLLTALVGGLCVPTAFAGGITPLPQPAAGGPDPVFGAWLPGPSSQGSSVYYRSPYLTPVSNPNSAEIISFSCNYPQTYINADGQAQQGDMPKSLVGQPISQDDLNFVSDRLQEARNYYFALINSGPDQADMPDWMNNISGINESLDQNPANDNNYSQAQASFVLYQATHYLATTTTLKWGDKVYPNPPQRQVLVAPTYNISGVAANIPNGCDTGDLESVTSGDSLGFHTLISKPWSWVGHLMVFIIASPIEWVYGEVQPYTFAYGFYTPHSERGDLIFNAAFSCKPAPLTGFATQSIQNQVQAQQQTQVQDSCQAGQPTGFSQANLTNATSTNPKKTPAWLAWSIFFQWLISCTYFIILFGGAIIYMSRADHKSSYTIVQMMPKLVLSIILTIGLNFLIGGVISFGNYLVQTMFSLDDASAVNGVRDIFVAIAHAEPDSNDPAAMGVWFGANLLAVGLMVIALFYLARILLFAVWRQIVLLILIALAPFATFCIIHPKLQHHFARFAKALAAIALAPAAMAFILKLGIAVNPAVSNDTPLTSNIGVVLIGALALLVTFHLMARVPAVCKAIVKNRAVGDGMSGKLGGMMKSLAPIAGVLGSPVAGFALAGAGAGLSGMGKAGQKSALGMASLIPDQKIRSTLSGPQRAGILGRMAQSEFTGDLAGMAGAAALEAGMSHGGKAGLALEAGGLAGLGDALTHGGGAALGVGAGALLGGMFRGNQRTQMHFKNFERRRYSEQGVRRISGDTAQRFLHDQQEAVAQAAKEWNPAEHDGQKFDADKWLHESYWAPTEKGGMGRQRVIRRGAVAGANAAFFIAEDWTSRHAARPLTSSWSRAGHYQAPPADEAEQGWQSSGGHQGGWVDAPGGYGDDPEADAYVGAREWAGGTPNVPPGGSMPPPPPPPSPDPARRRRGPSHTARSGFQPPRTAGFRPFDVSDLVGRGLYSREALRLARNKATLSQQELRDQVGKMTEHGSYDDSYRDQLTENLYWNLIEQGVINEAGDVNQSAFNSEFGREQMRQVDLDAERDNSTVSGGSNADNW